LIKKGKKQEGYFPSYLLPSFVFITIRLSSGKLKKQGKRRFAFNLQLVYLSA
jgi:hypothetical protein